MMATIVDVPGVPTVIRKQLLCGEAFEMLSCMHTERTIYQLPVSSGLVRNVKNLNLNCV